MTLILKQEELKNCVSISVEGIKVIEDAFKNLSEGNAIMPPIMRLDIEENNGEVDVKTAYIKGLDSFAIKMSPGFFDNPKIGLPSTGGLMVLLSSKTGTLEAVLLDKGYLTDIRTALAGAISVKYLAKKEISSVGIIGAGAQAKLQLEALMLVRKPSELRIWSRDSNKTKNYITEVNKKFDIKILMTKNPQEVTENSEVVITTTPSTTPLIKSEWLHPGLHITAMGSDAEHKNEIDPQIIKKADMYVCDSQSQTAILGELNHAIKTGLIDKNVKFTEIGDIVSGSKKGRKNDQEITICDLTGTGIQDTAIARLALKKAKNKNLGISI
ncbi:MAG: cyclodeaminase [Pelagibacteraceae bacterium]|nr:cyclodeaminase [Pelagibacteraceae bacterium]